MAHIQTKSRIEATKPRSGSISDTSKLHSALSSLKLEEDSSKSDGIHEQELSGVFLKRIPLVEPDFKTNSTIPSYQYHIENKRSYDVRILMTFTGTNFKAIPASSGFSQPSTTSVEGVIGKGASSYFALLEAADKSQDFTFQTDVKIYPVQDDIQESDLQGVKLFTIISYSGIEATMHFEALNNKDFDIEVELSLQGKIKEKSGDLPFKKAVKVGERTRVGTIKSDDEIETNWKWTALADDTPNPQKKHVQTSELKGVTLEQKLTPGDPTKVDFDVKNGRDKKIRVEIDLSGEGHADFLGNPRPLTGLVSPGQTTYIGTVHLRGDCEVNWKFKEEAE